jgi:hypothetical protein
MMFLQAKIPYGRHHGSPEITFDEPDRASAIWAMSGLSVWNHGVKERWFLGMGHYDETDEKRSETRLFTNRRLRYHFTQTSVGAIFPPPGRAGDQAARTAPQSASALG